MRMKMNSKIRTRFAKFATCLYLSSLALGGVMTINDAVAYADDTKEESVSGDTKPASGDATASSGDSNNTPSAVESNKQEMYKVYQGKEANAFDNLKGQDEMRAIEYQVMGVYLSNFFIPYQTTYTSTMDDSGKVEMDEKTLEGLTTALKNTTSMTDEAIQNIISRTVGNMVDPVSNPEGDVPKQLFLGKYTGEKKGENGQQIDFTSLKSNGNKIALNYYDFISLVTGNRNTIKQLKKTHGLKDSDTLVGYWEDGKVAFKFNLDPDKPTPSQEAMAVIYKNANTKQTINNAFLGNEKVPTGDIEDSKYEDTVDKYYNKSMYGWKMYVDTFGNLLVDNGSNRTVIMPASMNPMLWTKNTITQDGKQVKSKDLKDSGEIKVTTKKAFGNDSSMPINSIQAMQYMNNGDITKSGDGYKVSLPDKDWYASIAGKGNQSWLDKLLDISVGDGEYYSMSLSASGKQNADSNLMWAANDKSSKSLDKYYTDGLSILDQITYKHYMNNWNAKGRGYTALTIYDSGAYSYKLGKNSYLPRGSRSAIIRNEDMASFSNTGKKIDGTVWKEINSKDLPGLLNLNGKGKSEIRMLNPGANVSGAILGKWRTHAIVGAISSLSAQEIAEPYPYSINFTQTPDVGAKSQENYVAIPLSSLPSSKNFGGIDQIANLDDKGGASELKAMSWTTVGGTKGSLSEVVGGSPDDTNGTLQADLSEKLGKEFGASLFMTYAASSLTPINEESGKVEPKLGVPDYSMRFNNTPDFSFDSVAVVGKKSSDDERISVKKANQLMDMSFNIMNPVGGAKFIVTWFSNTMNGIIYDTHRRLTGANSSSYYTGAGNYSEFNGFIYQPKMSDTDFTANIKMKYDKWAIYLIVLMFIAVFLYIIRGDFSIQKGIMQFLIFCLLIGLPIRLVDTVIGASNQFSTGFFTKKFNYFSIFQLENSAVQIANNVSDEMTSEDEGVTATPDNPSEIKKPANVSEQANKIVLKDASTKTSSNYQSVILTPDKLKDKAYKLARAISDQFPEIKTIGGYRPSDPYPDHPSGQALDVMIPDYKSEKGKKLGDEILQYIWKNKDVFDINYNIWQQKYYKGSASNGEMMEDRGDDTQNHLDHLHILTGDLDKPDKANDGKAGKIPSRDGSGTSGGDEEESSEEATKAKKQRDANLEKVDLSGVTDEAEYEAAVTKYSNNENASGVTLRWMSPRKDNYNGLLAQSINKGLNTSNTFFGILTGSTAKQQSKQEIRGTANNLYVSRQLSDITANSRIIYNNILGSGQDHDLDSYTTVLEKSPSVLSKPVGEYLKGDKEDTLSFREKQGFINESNNGGDSFEAKHKRAVAVISSVDVAKAAERTIKTQPITPTSVFGIPAEQFNATKDYFVKDKATFEQAINESGSKDDQNKDEVEQSSDLNLDPSTVAGTGVFALQSESPYYYFAWNLMDNGMGSDFNSEGTMKDLLLGSNEDKSSYFYNRTGKKDSPGYNEVKDFMDMSTLFHVTIPYLNQLNRQYQDFVNQYGLHMYEHISLKGPEANGIKTSDPEYHKYWYNYNLSRLQNQYTPWVDAMYSADYAKSEKIKYAGHEYTVKDPLNPEDYLNKDKNGKIKGRPMIFSVSEMHYYGLEESNLTTVEKNILKANENARLEMLPLMNYYTFHDSTMTSVMAMTQTFEFNKAFSQTGLFGQKGAVTLEPQSWSLTDFSYDAYLRLILANSTGESLSFVQGKGTNKERGQYDVEAGKEIGKQDSGYTYNGTTFDTTVNGNIYERILAKTSWITGILLIVSDVLTIYALTLLRYLFLIGVLILSVLILIVMILTTEANMKKLLTKAIFKPLFKVVTANVAFAFIISRFLSNGITTVTGNLDSGITMGIGATLVGLIVLELILILVYYNVIRTMIQDTINVGQVAVNTFRYLTSIATNVATSAVGGGGAGVMSRMFNPRSNIQSDITSEDLYGSKKPSYANDNRRGGHGSDYSNRPSSKSKRKFGKTRENPTTSKHYKSEFDKAIEDGKQNMNKRKPENSNPYGDTGGSRPETPTENRFKHRARSGYDERNGGGTPNSGSRPRKQNNVDLTDAMKKGRRNTDRDD